MFIRSSKIVNLASERKNDQSTAHLDQLCFDGYFIKDFYKASRNLNIFLFIVLAITWWPTCWISCSSSNVSAACLFKNRTACQAYEVHILAKFSCILRTGHVSYQRRKGLKTHFHFCLDEKQTCHRLSNSLLTHEVWKLHSWYDFWILYLASSVDYKMDSYSFYIAHGAVLAFWLTLSRNSL